MYRVISVPNKQSVAEVLTELGREGALRWRMQ